MLSNEIEMLDVEAAALMLNAKVSTIRHKANRGEIPGKKVGKGWVFVKAHLAEWVSGRYDNQRLDTQAVDPQETSRYKESTTWQSTKGKRHGGRTTSTQMDDEYNALLGLNQKNKPNISTTNCLRSVGKLKS